MPFQLKGIFNKSQCKSPSVMTIPVRHRFTKIANKGYKLACGAILEIAHAL